MPTLRRTNSVLQLFCLSPQLHQSLTLFDSLIYSPFLLLQLLQLRWRHLALVEHGVLWINSKAVPFSAGNIC